MLVLSIILTALLSAALGAVAGSVIGQWAVRWYRISGVDAASAYFVLAMGVLGVFVGAVIGGVCAGISGAETAGAFFRGLGLGLGVTLAIAAAAAVIARALADIPPEIDGQDLFLKVEVRCPASRKDSPANESGDAYLLLGSLAPFRRVVRKSERGPLWKEEAKLVDGNWTVIGAVEVFTSRGKRMLQVAMGTNWNEGFIVPLRRHPGKRDLQWSDWLPRYRPGVGADSLTYRFRVQRWSEPMRTETFGPFEIDTITRGYHHASRDGRNRLDSSDTFRVRHRGQTIKIVNEVDGTKTWHERMLSVGTLDGGGDSPALLVNADLSSETRTNHSFFLITQTPAGDAKVELVADGAGSDAVLPLREFVPPPSKPDAFYLDSHRTALSPDALYRVGMNTILDTRDRRVYRFTLTEGIYDPNSVPICVSPDRRSFVRYGLVDGKEVALAATDFVADRTDILRLDRGRMHFSRRAQLNAAWIDHHFAWQPDGDGHQRLVERNDFAPIPFRGDLKVDYANRPCYRLDCVGKPMRAAIEEILVQKLGAVRQPTESVSDYEHEFRLDGKPVKIACADEFTYLLVEMDPSIGADRAAAVAAALDEELASGKYDELFLPVFPMD